MSYALALLAGAMLTVAVGTELYAFAGLSLFFALGSVIELAREVMSERSPKEGK